jgi:hypothetical protein
MRWIALVFAAMLGVGPAAAAAQPCQPVAHGRLEALLPVLNGFGRNPPKGETDPQEAVSRTTVDYEAATGAARISIELIDSCRNPDMLALLKETLATGPPATPGTVFRSLAVHGFPAYEEWTAESKYGEVHVLVAERFTVKVTGELVESRAVVENAAKAITLDKLAALK